MPEYRIRYGDWCYLCGIPMVPASAKWTAATLPAGMRIHGGKGLCTQCKTATRTRPGLLVTLEVPAVDSWNELPGRTVAEKLALNSQRDGSCLRWTGAHQPRGYGQMRVNGRARSVHRLAYELAFGDPADGLDIDHVVARGCRFRDCIEPTHLEAVTHAENLRRMRAARKRDVA